MKRNFLRLVLALGLIAMPLSSAFSGMSTMTDEDLGVVAARGFELVGPPASENNFDSVVLSNGAQDWASGGSILNAAGSSVNSGQNIGQVQALGGIVAQTNVQVAGVKTEADQPILQDDVKGQTNNNGSVDLVGSENGLKAVSLANMAGSGANIGQNIGQFQALGAIVAQTNVQVAAVKTEAGQTILQDDVKGQTNNNQSVQLVGSQNKASGLSLANMAGSGANIGQNIGQFQALGAIVAQTNVQVAAVKTSAGQAIESDDVARQKNNNGSVDLVGSENGLSVLSLVNAAVSAVNVGQNIASVGGNDVVISQVNVQLAYADNDKDQTIGSENRRASQSNNSSVSLNGSQANASGLILANLAGSAVNVGQNILSMKGTRGAVISQGNFQKAW